MTMHGRKFVAGILIVMSGFSLIPDRAHAIPVAVVADPFVAFSNVLLAAGNVSAGVTAASTAGLVKKEFVLDSIAYIIIEAARVAVVRSVIDWINNGFQGSPAFIQNLKGYLVNVADKIATEFITGSGLDALCSPFALNIKGALTLDYKRNRARGNMEPINSCSFKDITKNVADFGKNTQKSFTTNDFFAYASNPVNTPQGAYADAKAKLEISITNKKGEETKLLDFGRGFLSKKECTKVENREVCSIITPGDTISASLNKSLGLGADALVTADELNEIVGAFIGYLLSSTLKGGLGKANYSGETGDIGYRYTEPTSTSTTGTTSGISAYQLAETKKLLEDMIPLQQAGVNRYSGLIRKLKEQCSSAQGEEAIIMDIKIHSAYDTYLATLKKQADVTRQLTRMQDLLAITNGTASTLSGEALSVEITALMQSPDSNIDTETFEYAAFQREREVNMYCPAGLY